MTKEKILSLAILSIIEMIAMMFAVISTIIWLCTTKIVFFNVALLLILVALYLKINTIYLDNIVKGGIAEHGNK